MSINGSDTESSSLRSSQRRKGVIDTRRAEQNRAAQRAFRQRKERYVKELESKVCELQGLQERLEKLEEENTHLQQRLWELEHRPPVSAQVPAPPAPAPTPAAATPVQPSSWAANRIIPITSTKELSPPQEQNPRSPPRQNPSLSSAVLSPSTASESPPPGPGPHQQHRHPRYRPYASPSSLPPPATSSSRSTSSGHPIRLSDQHSRMRPPVISIHDESQAPASDNGQVLDDLITILRSRNRPPIPSQADKPAGSYPPSSSGSPPPLESKQIGTKIH